MALPAVPVIVGLLKSIGSRLAGLGALNALGRALKWFFTGTFLEQVIKRVVVWSALLAVGGPLIKAFKIGSMVFVYYVVLRVVGSLGLDSLADGLVASLGVLPSQVVCALKLLGFGDVVRLFVSTASTVGTIKILLRIASG